MKTEYLNMPFEVKAAEESDDGKLGILEGYAAGIGNIDHGLDKIIKGAFKKTIREKKGKWPVLADHHPGKQIGFNVEASEDDHGLLIKEELNLDVELGRERYSLAKQALRLKVPFGLSIGYDPVKIAFEEDADSGNKIRLLKEIRMWEHSHVTFPMNENAFITGAKQYKFEQIGDVIRDIIENSEKLGKSQDEIVKKIQSILNSYSEPDEIVHSLNEITNIFK